MSVNKLYKVNTDYTSYDNNNTVFKKSDIVEECSNQELPSAFNPKVWCRVKIIKTDTSSDDFFDRMHQEGLIIFHYLDEIDELSMEPWYCDKTDIKDVMTKVKTGEMGSFMVHDSEHCRVIVVHQGPDLGCSIHLIRTDIEEMHFVTPQIRFISVKHLVRYYSKHSNFFNCTLVRVDNDPNQDIECEQNQENEYPLFKEYPEAENNVELRYYKDFLQFHKHYWAKRVKKGQQISWEQYLLRVFRTIQLEGVMTGELIKCQIPEPLHSAYWPDMLPEWEHVRKGWLMEGKSRNAKKNDFINILEETLSFLKKVKDGKFDAQKADQAQPSKVVEQNMNQKIESINLPDQPAPIDQHVQHQDNISPSQPGSNDQMLVMRHVEDGGSQAHDPKQAQPSKIVEQKQDQQIESINLPNQPAPIDQHVQHQPNISPPQPRSRDQMLMMRYPNQHYHVRHAQSSGYYYNRQHPYPQPPNNNAQPIEAPMQDQAPQVPMVLGASGRYFYDPPVRFFQ